MRREKQPLDPELLRRLYADCEGWIQRMHEKLAEEEGVRVPYPTLTRKLRALSIGTPQRERCARVQERSHRNGRIFHAQGLVQWGRDFSMKLLGERYLKGKVSFTSDAQNGTTFQIVLPL